MVENPVMLSSIIIFSFVVLAIIFLILFSRYTSKNSGFKDLLDYLEETDNANKWIYTTTAELYDDEENKDESLINTDLDDDKEFFNDSSIEEDRNIEEKKTKKILKKKKNKKSSNSKELDRNEQTIVNLNRNYQRLRDRVVKLEKQINFCLRKIERHNNK